MNDEKLTKQDSGLPSRPLIGSMACPRCGGNLEKGKALQNTVACSILDFPNADDLSGQTFSYSGEAQMIEVFKCADCGYSRT